MKMQKIPKSIAESFKEYIFNIEDTKFVILSDYDIQKHVIHLSDFTNNMHVHTHYEIFYVSNGVITVKFDTGVEEFSKGDVFIVPPRVKYMVLLAEQGATHYGISFDFYKNSLKDGASLYDMLDKFMAKDRVVSVKNVPFLEEIFKKITFDEMQSDEMAMSLHLHELFMELLRNHGEKSGHSLLGRKLSDSNMIRLYKLEQMIFGSNTRSYSLNDIAEELFLSTRQVSRIIQQHYGCTYRELVETTRMEIAAGLLADTDMNILEVASKSGYNSIKSFYTNFKEKFGCLPSEYRKIKKTEKGEQEQAYEQEADEPENNDYIEMTEEG